jgi:hypothetical protein
MLRLHKLPRGLLGDSMLLEVLLILLLVGAAAATILSFFIWKEKPQSPKVWNSTHDSDNPQRDI